MPNRTKIKIDRTTLPKDGQRVRWQTYHEDGTDTWKEGRFSAGEDVFCLGFSDIVKDWDLSFNVYHWEPLEGTAKCTNPKGGTLKKCIHLGCSLCEDFKPEIS